MLSILIPTYNYNIFPLVQTLQTQCVETGIAFEIISIDDGSNGFSSDNNRMNSLDNCRFESLPHNIGRSKIRNLLGSKAKYQSLLFLDADVMPVNEDFIQIYIKEIGTAKVISGGLKYQEQKPESGKLLRWVYGNQRESLPAQYRQTKPYQTLLSSNFIIDKATFAKVPFEENMPDLRREDTLFSYHLMTAHVSVMHIENPVFHLGLDDFETAILKEKQSLEGLLLMLRRKMLPASYSKLSKLYSVINKLGLCSAVAGIFNSSEKSFLKNLSGENPSMMIFDAFRIGYMCSLSSKYK